MSSTAPRLFSFPLFFFPGFPPLPGACRFSGGSTSAIPQVFYLFKLLRNMIRQKRPELFISRPPASLADHRRFESFLLVTSLERLALIDYLFRKYPRAPFSSPSFGALPSHAPIALCSFLSFVRRTVEFHFNRPPALVLPHGTLRHCQSAPPPPPFSPPPSPLLAHPVHRQPSRCELNFL